MKKSLLQRQANYLTGKTVVVTGASSGVGKAIALEIAKRGANLVIAARRISALKEVAGECERTGGRVLVVATDVTDYGAVENLAATANAWGGKIDVWVNNAGLLGAGKFEEIPAAVNNKIIDTNLTGYVNGAHAVLRYFKRQGSGIIINNISVGGWFPVPFAAAYSASKFGLRGFSEALKGELYNWPGIHICDVFPAFLDTPGIQHAANYTGKVLKPAPPVYDPQKVANAIAELAREPKPSTVVGSVASMLRYSHAVFPELSRWVTAGVIDQYLKQAKHTPQTSGNVLEPLYHDTSIRGGWKMPAKPRQKLISGVLVATAVAVGFALFTRKRLAENKGM